MNSPEFPLSGARKMSSKGLQRVTGSSRTCQLDVAKVGIGVIQAPEPEPRIMLYELTDFERTAIRPFLPKKPRGMPRVNDRRVLDGIF